MDATLELARMMPPPQPGLRGEWVPLAEHTALAIGGERHRHSEAEDTAAGSPSAHPTYSSGPYEAEGVSPTDAADAPSATDAPDAEEAEAQRLAARAKANAFRAASLGIASKDAPVVATAGPINPACILRLVERSDEQSELPVGSDGESTGGRGTSSQLHQMRRGEEPPLTSIMVLPSVRAGLVGSARGHLYVINFGWSGAAVADKMRIKGRPVSQRMCAVVALPGW